MKGPYGKIIYLTVHGYIPYLVDEPTEQLVLPAVDAAREAEPDGVPEEGAKRDLKKIAQGLPRLLTRFPKNQSTV